MPRNFAIKVNLLFQNFKPEWFSRVPQSKFETNLSRGFLIYDRTDKQTNRNYYFKVIELVVLIVLSSLGSLG